MKLIRDSETHFEPIICGERVTLSVQASEFHYSNPRKTLPSSGQYREFEVAILRDGRIVNPRDIQGFPMDLAPWFDCSNSPVAAYVPRAVVCRMILALQGMTAT